VVVRGAETLSLGGDVTVSVHAIPGHTAGSVAYVVDSQDDVFVGDAVQVRGAANGFPGYEDPRAYRASLEYLLDVVRPRHLYLGHPYRTADGVPYGVALDRDQAREALQGSLDIEARVAAAASRHRPQETDSAYSPFAAVAAELGYTGDPTLEPSPFFTTLHGYREQFDREGAHTHG
jgi:glyoxylase-like metal-dependent hydrolase (beta-lactamase superfamily II)